LQFSNTKTAVQVCNIVKNCQNSKYSLQPALQVVTIASRIQHTFYEYLITTTVKAGVYTGIQNYHEKLRAWANPSVKPQYNIATNNYHRGLMNSYGEFFKQFNLTWYVCVLTDKHDTV